MTLYEKLFDLKYRQGVPTYELAHRFPEHVDRINEVALLDIPENTLKEVLSEKRILERVISLKKQFKKSDLSATSAGKSLRLKSTFR